MTVEEEDASDQEKHETLLTHVVLPRHLPQTKSHYIHDEDVALMSCMVDNVLQNEVLLKIVPPNTVKMLRNLRELHKTLTTEVIAKQLSALAPGETFAMFVRRQNCALMIHMPLNQSDRVVAATFPGNLHPKYFRDNNDIQFNYPTQALVVPYTEMLRSEDFANQLRFLYDELPIETKNPDYVSKWLVTLLADDKTTAAAKFPVITKKIRDEILGEHSSDYFRRSNMYMCAKVFLQQSLTIEIGPERGRLLYKLIMIQFLTSLLDYFNHIVCDPLNIDLVRQSMAKLARRIEKLSILMKESKIHALEELYKEINSHAKATLAAIRKKIDDQILQLQEKDSKSAELAPLIDLDFEADVKQRVAKLCKYLEMRKHAKVLNEFDSNFLPNGMHRLYRQKQIIPDLSVLKSMTEETEICIYANDFECCTLYDFNLADKSEYTVETIRDWAFDYLSIVNKFSIDDQLSMSRMILTLLKLIAGLDIVACRAHSLLKQHRTCIDPKIFNSLLLPQREDMEIAFELEQYFRERNSDAKYPGLVEEQSVTPNSFTARFAAQNEHMQTTLNKINHIESIRTDQKKSEWQICRDKVEILRAQVASMSHEYWTNWHNGKTRHDRYCNRCRIETSINAMKIEAYEKPLPCESECQMAVVFELECPIEISCLRDVLFCFAKLAENPTQFRIDRLFNDKISNPWVAYHQIQHLNSSDSKLVKLGNRNSLTVRKLHVDNDFSQFVVKNGLNSKFYGSASLLPATIKLEHIKDLCTLKTENEYSNLQWTLYGTDHTQNQVIAKQNECDEQLSLLEFKNFGSLRADGHRLHLRKLYGMIRSEALSFEKSSVLSLVIQSLWETGISGDGGSIRESHMDCRNMSFATAMIELLDSYCERERSNWVNPNKLLMATLIAVRVFELNDNENLAERIVKLLDKIRTFALDWMSKIAEAIQRTYAKKIHRNKDLHMKLLCASLTGAATFFVNSCHEFFEKVFIDNSVNNYSAARVWLQFANSIKNNILSNVDKSQLPLNFRMLQRMMHNIGIHIEHQIRSSITDSVQVRQDIFKLEKILWSRLTSASSLKWSFLAEQPQVLLFTVSYRGETHRTTIDIVTGEFLVNGRSVDRTPITITLAKHYQRVFEDFHFEVQPDSYNQFCTVQRYDGCQYEFMHCDSTTVIITEKCNGIEKELIPHEHLSGDIPHHLVNNYSHFWNKKTNVIEFRPKLFTDRNFSSESAIEYRLDLNDRRLIHAKTQLPMLDITSKSFSKVTKHLSRLELPEYMLVSMEKPRIAKVELIRMRLKFIVDTSMSLDRYDMVSNEFVRMRVSLKQNIGTLYGLQHGLVLETIPSQNCTAESSSSSSSTLLILPHGTIETKRSGWHVSVNIANKNDLRSPPFHQYEVDEFCRQVKSSSSSYSAWFYLAYLHAVTSHGEIEPLIGMSGTERALQILQSGLVWSAEPYDEHATKMLCAIAEITPKRQSKNASRQQVNWPSFIPPRSAQDSFILIAQRLLDDSQRLSGLYPKTKSCHIEIETNIHFNRREYFRCLALDSNMKISERFLPHETLQTTSLDIPPMVVSKQTQTVSILYHQQQWIVPHDLDLMKFLMSETTLNGIANMDCVQNLLYHQSYGKFVNLWICLYEYARKGALNDRQFVLIWSVLAHEGNAFGPILALQAIAMNRLLFRSNSPPAIDNYQPLEGFEFKANEVELILKRYHTVPCKFRSMFCNTVEILEEKRDYENRISMAIVDIVTAIERKWPCDTINIAEQPGLTDLDVRTASTVISEKLKIWNDNRKLKDFISCVEDRLKTLVSTEVSIPIFQPIPVISPKNWQKYEINFNKKMCKRLSDFKNEMREAHGIWKESPHLSNRTAQEWWSVYENVIRCDSQHLIDAGLYPRAVPSLVLPQIVSNGDGKLVPIIGALAVSIAQEQRQHRMALYERHDHLKDALMRETENQPYVNWKPCEYPEWLLFEIEQNLSIRRIQIEVAKRMIDPEIIDDEIKHSVMQLNMGEGKTAVITPIVAAVLANGSQTCQITVLKSLFATNLKSLRRFLGGMLNRRIYIFPCRRDMPVSSHVDRMLDIYNECMEMKGVILTLPEYRLSFQLKTYECIHNSKYDVARKFLNIQHWIDNNIRNILDESDAILHPKYQLIYTLGKQLALGGGESRWTVIQAILKRVPEHMRELYRKHGSEKIEYDEHYVTKCLIYGASKVDYRADVFTPCRILDETVYDELKLLLIEDFLDGRIDIPFQEMKASSKEILRQFLSEKNITKEHFDQIMVEFSINERNLILIMSGLLRFEILKLVLMKRWRVNYGVNKKGLQKRLEDGGRKMAIPFKSKDVAAEMTEFGHPDVALCFTQLSYYYSGLNDEQLKETFKLLATCNAAASVYNKWVESVPCEIIDTSIEVYSGINLSDWKQRDMILFPTYRFNMHVIDFYLSKKVFPVEAKMFVKKLMCTTWDLCSFMLKHPVTGFSGTNDTKNILPMSVEQRDLKELESTNEDVRKTLLLPGNQAYDSLEANVSGKSIIQKLVKHNVPVLLDAGALMLELNNEQVAKEWLALSSERHFDAAVYFDTNDVLQTIDRNGIVTEFDCSVYREKLNKCLVYLDDVHTRGTDMKFPMTWKACVTLSGDITRDKTVQACMRMRQLGRGQTIAFWASYEANLKIQRNCQTAAQRHECTRNHHVIEFICSNSQKFEMENTVHWAAGAYNYTKKLLGHLSYSKAASKSDLLPLLQACMDDECIDLVKMYGDKQEAPLADITNFKFDKLATEFSEHSDFINSVKCIAQSKIVERAPNVKRFMQALDEEQERELEKEMEPEEVRQIERPYPIHAATPHFDEKLKTLILQGVTTDIMSTLLKAGTIVSISNGLSNTQLIRGYTDETRAWSNRIFVTKDFQTTTKNGDNHYHQLLSSHRSDPSRTSDEYLRPVWWVAGIKQSTTNAFFLLLLSSFECDRLVSSFEKSQFAVLYPYRAKLTERGNNLLHQRKLQMSAMITTPRIDVHDEAQLAVYSGSMFFSDNREQDAYCNFLGLIPRPRTKLLESAFRAGLINPNGFVPPKNRSSQDAIFETVGKCKFQQNPVNLVIRLIEAHHRTMPKECHASLILQRGAKFIFTEKYQK